MITATYFGERVQVVDALDGIATVRSLNPAHTWASWTHGGWAMDNETNAPVRMLTDIDPGEDAAEQARRSLGDTDERPLPYDYQSDYVPTEKASER
jgi:hypothetical protein